MKIKFEKVLPIVRKVVVSCAFALICRYLYLDLSGESLEAAAFILGACFALSLILLSVRNKILPLIPWLVVGAYFIWNFVDEILQIFA